MMQGTEAGKFALAEVETRLADLARSVDPHKAAERARFMKVTMPLLGLTVPQQRQCLKKKYSFSKLSFAEQVPIWGYVWNHATTHEAKVQAALYVEKPGERYDPVWLWQELEPWVMSVNCWDQSDCLSRIYSQLLEEAPEHVVPILKRWNESDNPWERRQSLVALLFYSRFRNVFPDEDLVFSLIRARLEDEDYYVQKGLGWALREAYHVWPQRMLAFLDEVVGVLAPAAWQAATEKLDPSVKQRLKINRKVVRGR
ncbi:DNA alkylation repair protein [Cohaesibacter gelatinilyticus]|nr:DNA alkylation repair protein [Cohaesibacter gelatinilyticus]HAT85632.1 DNA alkylation repair protein [Hyphomicrobiales bacterium]